MFRKTGLTSTRFASCGGNLSAERSDGKQESRRERD
jgi:hypothetical protein